MQLIMSVEYKARDKLTSWESLSAEINICNLSLAFWQEFRTFSREDISYLHYYYHYYYYYYYHHRYFLRNSLFSRTHAFVERIFKSFSAAVRQLLDAHNEEFILTAGIDIKKSELSSLQNHCAQRYWCLYYANERKKNRVRRWKVTSITRAARGSNWCNHRV